MNSRPRIAVVGASVRGAAFSLLSAGCDVVAADLFADADLARVCAATRIENYPDGLANWLAKTPCDGWLYTGALENHPELVDHMAQLRPLLGNRGEVLRQIRDLLLLQEVLGEVFCFPETRACAGSMPGTAGWLHKTGQGGNGSGVSYLTDKLPKSGYWQRRVQGTLGSAQFIADESGVCRLLGITQLLVGAVWTNAGEFQYCGTLAPWMLTSQATDTLRRIGVLLATTIRLRGLYGVDFIFDGDDVWIIEVNPRITAAVEIVERVTGINRLCEHLAAFGVVVPGRSSRRVIAAGKAVLYAKRPVTISRQLSEQLMDIADEIERPQVADIPNAGTEISPGEPILTVLASGSDLIEVEAKLRQQIADLEAQLYRDTGGC